MDAVCQFCGTTLCDEDISATLNVARCSHCSALTDLGGSTDTSEVQPPSAEAAGCTPRAAATGARAEIPLPDGVRVEVFGTDLTITRRWFSSSFYFLLLFCLFWDGFLFFWYTDGLSAGPRGNLNLMMLLFPLGHVAVGIGVTYLTLASLINRTLIQVAGGSLSIHHEPLPWPGRVCIPAADIEQVYCSERYYHSDNGSTFRHAVNAVLKNGRQIRLLKGLDDADQALYIEQIIEEHLGISDIPVDGEMPR